MMTVRAIFDRFDGPAEVGRIIGKPTEHATVMRRRGSIPVRYWPALLAAAKEKGLSEITHEALVEAHTARKRAA